MAALTRWAAGVEYQGTAYSGWQSLPGRATVQGTLEAALSTVADAPVAVITAGRTDAGVHALQQVVHFDSAATRRADSWLFGVNSLLPEDISLRWVQLVPAAFHARFGAIRRDYRYVIHNRRTRSALLAHRATWLLRPLDVEAMAEAAQALLGEHDFSSFRDSQCQAPSPVRRLETVSVRRQGDFVLVDVGGNAFLHHMVRNIVGTLAEVGYGRQPVSWVAAVLAARDRRLAGMTAAADGLYFVGPRYAAEFNLPPPPTPWFPTA